MTRLAQIVIQLVAFTMTSNLWAAPPQQSEKKNLQFYIKGALTQSFEDQHFGAGDKRAFENEVLSEGQLFVTNYNTTAEGTSVQVDNEKLKQYLKFQSALFAVQGDTKNEATVCMSV